MLHLHSDHYYSLDDVATRLWQLLLEHNETEQVVAHMLAEYQVDESQLRADLLTWLNFLTDAGLATVSNDAPLSNGH